MKNLMVVIAALFFSSSMIAQNVIEKNFQQFKDAEQFTNITISGKLFELASYMDTKGEDKELDEFVEFVTTIESAHMIVGNEMKDLKNQYMASVKKIERGYEELMSVEDKEGNFKFFINESNGIVKELVMVGMTGEELLIGSILGKMDLRQLGKMTAKIQTDGFGKMGKMFDHGVDELKIYPNPVSAEAIINVEVPNEMVGGNATLFDMNGAAVKNYTISNSKEALKTDGLSGGAYVLELRKDKVSIRKKLVIQ